MRGRGRKAFVWVPPWQVVYCLVLAISCLLSPILVQGAEFTAGWDESELAFFSDGMDPDLSDGLKETSPVGDFFSDALWNDLFLEQTVEPTPVENEIQEIGFLVEMDPSLPVEMLSFENGIGFDTRVPAITLAVLQVNGSQEEAGKVTVQEALWVRYDGAPGKSYLDYLPLEEAHFQDPLTYLRIDVGIEGSLSKEVAVLFEAPGFSFGEEATETASIMATVVPRGEGEASLFIRYHTGGQANQGTLQLDLSDWGVEEIHMPGDDLLVGERLRTTLYRSFGTSDQIEIHLSLGEDGYQVFFDLDKDGHSDLAMNSEGWRVCAETNLGGRYFLDASFLQGVVAMEPAKDTLLEEYYEKVIFQFPVLEKVPVEPVLVFSQDAYGYTGDPIFPAFSVYVGEKEVKEEFYRVSYSAYPREPGTYTLTVSLPGRYEGTVTGSFTITPISIREATVTLSNTSFSYTGKEKKPAVTVSLGEERLRKKVDYSVTYLDNISSGLAKVVVTGVGHYEGEVVSCYQIARAPQPLKVKAKAGIIKVSKEELQADKVKLDLEEVFTVTKNQGPLSFRKVSGDACLSMEESSGKVSIAKNTEKGIYTMQVEVTALGNRNYEAGSVVLEVKVKVKS